MRLTIEAFGETVIDRQLTRFAANLAVPEAAWMVIGTMLRAAAEHQFDTEGGYASGGWPKLSDSRVAEKQRLGLAPQILRATNALMESLTRKFDSEHIERPISRAAMVFGSKLGYGIYHASTRPRTKIPYRPPVAITERDKILLVKELQRALLGQGPSAPFATILRLDPSHGAGGAVAADAGLGTLARDLGGER